MRFAIRRAEPRDVDAILRLIRQLAEYERLLDELVIDAARIRESFFSADARAFCDVAEVDGQLVGYAVWYYSYSTFAGRHGIYLEDVYVEPAHRGAGIGKAFLTALAARCVRERLARFEWSVLDWNEPSIAFYRSLQAVPLTGWTRFRLDGAALTELGART